MPRPITATIHLSAFKHNYSIAKQQSGAAKVWAVVKANAYGHSLTFARQALDNADGFALVEMDNAIKLREMGWGKPILLLEGFFHTDDLSDVQQHQIDIVVHCVEQIEMLEKAHFSVSATKINVYLKVNSGLNRLGFKPVDIRAAYQRLNAIKTVQVIDLMTHFANADDEFNPRLPVTEQLRQFEMAKASLGEVKIDTSLSNSGAILLCKSVKNNWARAGIILYGGSPNDANAADFGLLPAMTLRSELIAVQEIQAGDSVGYGSRFTASKPMKIGVVACGYADGYPRHAVDGTPILVNGIRTVIAGRVSMDLITVDVTDIVSAKVGSEVILWGKGLPIDEVARASGTVGYELMCAVAPRVTLIAED